MKVAAFLGQGQCSGGGFQQSLNAALQMNRICQGSYEFSVYTTTETNVRILQDLGLKTVYCEINFLDKIVGLASRLNMFQPLRSRLRIFSSFEKKLKTDGIDLIYFLTPSPVAACLQSLNYIFTVWDLCHRDFPEFPEVRDFGEFEQRELLYKSTLGKAYLIIADSDELKQKIVFHYKIDPSRIIIMPFQPAPACVSQNDSKKDGEALLQYNLTPGYLFYPAQFWSHKGHVRLLEALAIFRERNSHLPQTVFVGGDTGNLKVVTAMVHKLGLENAVRVLGFVPDMHIPSLYRGASALVMPTYFGPTNLPPLEAMSLGVPIIYPRHLSDQCGDSAIYFDVDDAASFCEAIEHVLCKLDRSHGRRISDKRLALMAEARSRAEVALRKRLDKFERRLMCWTSSK